MLNEVCTAALDTLDLVKEFADEVQNFDLSDPSDIVGPKILEWKDRGEDVLARLNLSDDGGK